MTNKILKLFLIIILLSSCQVKDIAPAPETTPTNTLEIIKNDMLLPHEGILNGLPTQFDWSQGPRIGWGNNPPSDWFAMIPWGQVYRDTNPLVASNTRIQIRNFQAWYLDNNNKWVEWTTTSDIFGKHYYENYQDDFNVSAEIRHEMTGGISIKFLDGYNFHFWPAQGRIPMNPQDIKGVWICVEARLILDNANQEDDRNRANFMLGTGGDYWKSLTANWDNFQSSGDIAIGRMKYITNEWKSFNMHTLTANQIETNPPPFD